MVCVSVGKEVGVRMYDCMRDGILCVHVHCVCVSECVGVCVYVNIDG